MITIKEFARKLESQVNRPWYPFALGFIALIDNGIFLLPIAAMMVTSTLTAPKRWFSLALSTTIGSAIGAVLFSVLVSHFGVSFIESTYPSLTHSQSWQLAAQWINHYGFWALFIFCALPISEHPAIIFAMAANIPIATVAVSITAGKIIKFFALAWIASHAPELLLKLKWFRKGID